MLGNPDPERNVWNHISRTSHCYSISDAGARVQGVKQNSYSLLLLGCLRFERHKATTH